MLSQEPRPVRVCAAALLGGTFAFASIHRFEPPSRNSPMKAVVELKELNLKHVFNDYDFGGYQIAHGVATFIDGRTELYGEKFFIDHSAASGLTEPDNLFRMSPAPQQHTADQSA